jgi:hypothetical protein
VLLEWIEHGRQREVWKVSKKAEERPRLLTKHRIIYNSRKRRLAARIKSQRRLREHPSEWMPESSMAHNSWRRNKQIHV